jgi:hypothetical protein
MTAAFKLEPEVLNLFNDNKYNTKFFSKLQTLTMAKYRVKIVRRHHFKIKIYLVHNYIT